MVVNFMRKEMLIQKRTTFLIEHFIKGEIFKKYICDELNDRYFQTQNLTNEYIQHIEQRDAQMTKHIHSLLQYPNNHRYFFAIGAGIFCIYLIKFIYLYFFKAHMLGRHQNIIVRLESLGYKITRICTDRNRMRFVYFFQN